MEFVGVNQDEMDNTWDSFESSFDFNDDLDVQQANTESAATSTTKNLATTSQNGMLQFNLGSAHKNPNKCILKFLIFIQTK